MVPFWAAFLLFRRSRVMPIVTADKVTVSQLVQVLTVIQHVGASNTIEYDQAQMKAVSCCLGRSRAEEKSPVSAR